MNIEEKLRSFAEAYPKDIFTPITPLEREAYPSIITRASGDMGRHFAPFALEAADRIAALEAALNRSADTFADLAKALQLLRRLPLANACRIAYEDARLMATAPSTSETPVKHSTEDDFQHFLSYSGLGASYQRLGRDVIDLRVAYYTGAGIDVTEPCSTCGGTGEIDETIGGIHTSNPHAPCPDCTPKTPAEPISDGVVRVVYEHGEPNGVRDTTGYLCFFHRVPKWPGQDERYKKELALRARQADAIATALGAVTETPDEFTCVCGFKYSAPEHGHACPKCYPKKTSAKP